MFFRIYPGFSRSLLLKGKRQILLTCKVSRYYLLALYGSRPIIGTNVCTMVYMSGDSPFIARRANRVPLCPDRLLPLVSRFDNKNTFIQCFNSQTVAQY